MNGLRALRIIGNALVMVALAAPVAGMEFRSRGEQDLQSIFGQIAAVGRMNVILSPTIPRIKMILNYKELEPRSALELVARLNNLTVKEVPMESADAVPTFVVGPPDDIAKGFETFSSRTIRLSFARAALVAAELQTQRGKDSTLCIGSDSRTNSVMVSGHPAEIARITQLVEALDLPVPQFALEVSLLLDGKEPLWTGQVDARSGQRSTFACSQDPRAQSGTARIGKLAGWVSGTCNKDSFLSLQIHIGGDLDLGQNPVCFGTTQWAQLKDGEKRSIYRIELAGGRVLELQVKPVVRKCEPIEAEPVTKPATPPPAPAPSPKAAPLEDLGDI